MAQVDLQAVHDEMIQVAYAAGEMILAANPGDIDIGSKLNAVDIVTEVDQNVEHFISSRLSQAFPNIGFMGEETYKPGMKIGPEPTFVVDPIDGTTNFIHSFPNACISLGLSVTRQPQVGVIYNPYQDLLFTAIAGKGAYMTRGRGSTPRRLPLAKNPSPLRGLGGALVAVEWGSDRAGHNFDIKTDVFRTLAAATAAGDQGGTTSGPKQEEGKMVHSLRSMGSAALNLASVAAGQMDMYWEGGCWAWDVCAGWCVLKEAGGIMVSGNGGEWNPQLDSRVYLAVRGAPEGQRELVEEFWEVLGDRKMDYRS